METTNKRYKGVAIVRLMDFGIGRFGVSCVVEGNRVMHKGTMNECQRAISKALTSSRVTIDRCSLVFPTSHDYFALAEAETKPMPTAEQVARMESLMAQHGLNK